jgi:hypothetical protein
MGWVDMLNAWGRAVMHTDFWLQYLKERDGFEERGIDGRITLKCILKKYDLGACTRLISLRRGTRGKGCCEHGNQPSFLMECGQDLD